MSGGSAGTAYAAEISALQTYQKQILVTLDSMVAGEAAMTIVAGISAGFTGTGANSGLGAFPEAVALSQTYSGVMQTLMTNFREISDLITTMANVLGKSAQNYMDTEQQLTDQFNKIVSQYEGKAGGFSTPGSPTATAPATTAPQTGTSNSYYTATTSTTKPATTTSTTSGSSNSIQQGNNSNASSNTSNEE